jgi:hypothetical protein
MSREVNNVKQDIREEDENVCLDEQIVKDITIRKDFFRSLEDQFDSLFDDFMQKATAISSQLILIKPQMPFENKEKLIRSVDRFGGINHLDNNHGQCMTVRGGSMHVFYQLIISIEKATFVPVSFCHSVKSLLDAYGKQVVELYRLEEDIRTARTLKEMSSGNSKKVLQFSEVLLEEYNVLIIDKIGVPSFFPFACKQVYSCPSCRKLCNPNIVSQHILKLEIISGVRSTSLSELMR